MELEIKRSDRKSFAIEIKNDKLVVRAPRSASDAAISELLRKNQRWIDTHIKKAQARQAAAITIPKLSEAELRELGERAKEIIPQRVAHYAPIVGADYGRITIRCQKTRWGSCSAKGNLNFNCLLMLAPPEVLDSVVVHELCHRLEMNHSDRFYAQVLRVFPRYYECRKWLKENGASLMARL